MHLGHRVLLPGRDGPAPQGVDASRQGGRLTGLVPVPGPHLLASAHDGRGAPGVGGAQPQPELPPHDGLPRGVAGDLALDPKFCLNFKPLSNCVIVLFLSYTFCPLNPFSYTVNDPEVCCSNIFKCDLILQVRNWS